MDVQTLKGFRDFLPQEARKRDYVTQALKEVFSSFGFLPLETPALEYAEVLTNKYGEEGEKLMYKFIDRGGRAVAMRYDQTVPLARVVAQYLHLLPMPFKRYQIQVVWRAENPQKGRYRELLQCDADIVGSSSPLADAETIVLAIKSLEKLGFKQFKILVNDRNIFQNLAEIIPDSEKNLMKVIRTVDKLAKIGQEGVIDELIDSGLSKEQAQKILEALGKQQPTPNLQAILAYLKEMGVADKVEFTPTLARGLDYYTGMIFEVVIPEYESGSVAGGGRYDKLIGLFSNKDIPAVGFALGFDRIVEAMEALNLFPQEVLASPVKVLVTIFNKDLVEKSLAALKLLRQANINSEFYFDENAPLEKQLKYADQKNIPYALIIGPEEAAENKATLKDLNQKTQERLLLDEITTKLSS